MNKRCFGCERIKGEDKEEFEVKYYLLKEERCEVSLNEKRIFYGIQISKCEIGSLTEYESNTVKDIGINENKAISILEELKMNKVTPVHLYDVIENFI